jgi:hypothetical protein
MKIIVFILLIVFIGSCDKREDPINRINKKLKIDSTGVLRKDVPEFYNDSTPYWGYAQMTRNRFGLPSIENGREVFEIRILEDLEGGRILLRIRYQGSTWIAENYIYRPFSTDGQTIDSIVVNYVNLGPPKSGWNKLINKLIDKGILDFKDELSFPGPQIIIDRTPKIVEIAAKNYYKYYTLQYDKTQIMNISDDAKSMARIIDLIRKEFPEIKSQINKFEKDSNASN